MRTSPTAGQYFKYVIKSLSLLGIAAILIVVFKIGVYGWSVTRTVIYKEIQDKTDLDIHLDVGNGQGNKGVILQDSVGLVDSGKTRHGYDWPLTNEEKLNLFHNVDIDGEKAFAVEGVS